MVASFQVEPLADGEFVDRVWDVHGQHVGDDEDAAGHGQHVAGQRLGWHVINSRW